MRISRKGRQTANQHTVSMSSAHDVIVLLIVLSISPLYAQEAAHSPKLPGMTVTASPYENRDEPEMTQPVNIMQGDHLRRKREASLGDTLSQELGVSSSSFGPGASRPIIRALDGPRIQILENGIGTLDASSLSPDHAVTVETLNASQIEILRGPATLLYGGGATGGVVNVVTDRIPTRLFKTASGNAEIRGNTATEEKAGSFNVNKSFGQMSWSLGAFKRKTEDYSIPGYANNSHLPIHSSHDPQANPNDRHIVRNSAVDSQGLSVGGSYIGERGFLGGSISLLENNYGIPSPELASVDQTQARYNLSGQLDQPVAGIEKIKVRTGYNDYKHKEIENSGEVATRFKNHELETRAEFLHAPIAGVTGLFGVQFQDRKFSAIGEEAIVPITQSRSTGIFIVEERNWEKVRLEFGGRYEHAFRNPQNITDPSRGFDLFSGSTGASWNFFQDYHIGLIAIHGQRAPAIEELYVNGIHHGTATFQVGDHALRKEAHNNVDLSLSKKSGFMRWKVNAFYNRFNHYIFYKSVDSNGDRLADRVNHDGELTADGEFLVQNLAQTDAVFYGAEAEVVFSLRPDNLDLRLFTDYVRARLGQHNGNVPRVTPQRFGFELNYRSGPFATNLTTIHVLRQNKVAELETHTSGYTLLNLEASYRLRSTRSNGIWLFVQGRNLLDEEMRVHTSYLKNFAPLPGRALIAGIRSDF
ncbi:TonB-dependent receptor [Nitrosomonas sp. JL21]|uniref:TonB-dependent receptor n=1 Tax=Nitrosomonas sp. JL21 TaxID=153949 RepID=UPI00136B1BA3|nr:TonB-dependent receptor [Nitrosomonas sp. JL21]MBL8497236.1 TonB-dependent receptor [Nitrosomonas sp.]MXS77105.1 TonB-dependent receptor [Nitrosomonas sp. JL21]